MWQKRLGIGKGNEIFDCSFESERSSPLRVEDRFSISDFIYPVILAWPESDE